MSKNKIFVNKVNSKSNNQVLANVESNIINVDNSIQEKLDKLFNTNGYIFNINVKIITDNRTYDTRIANKIEDNIITLDNDVISIRDIKDIIF